METISLSWTCCIPLFCLKDFVSEWLSISDSLRLCSQRHSIISNSFWPRHDFPSLMMELIYNPFSSGDCSWLPETSKSLVMRTSQNTEFGKTTVLLCFCSTAGWLYSASKKSIGCTTAWMFLSRSIACCIRQRPCTWLDTVCPEKWPIWTGNVEERGGNDKLNSHCGQAAGGQTHPSLLKSHDQCSSNRKIHIFTPLFPSFILSLFSITQNWNSLLISGHALGWRADTLHLL